MDQTWILYCTVEDAHISNDVKRNKPRRRTRAPFAFRFPASHLVMVLLYGFTFLYDFYLLLPLCTSGLKLN